MTEIRRLKLKIGDAEFEADVPDDKVQPMYDQFLDVLERRSRANGHIPGQVTDWSLDGGIEPPRRSGDFDVVVRAGPADASDDAIDPAVLTRVFDLRQDGAVTLKVLPQGPDRSAHALLLLLYGYYRLKNEQYVLATHLFRAGEQSGISVRRPANEHARNGRFVVRAGQRKGSNYSLSSQGLAMAKEITAKMIG